MAARDWRHRATCRAVDPETFFPVSEQGPGAQLIQEAKTFCQRCPVTDDCLQWALDHGQEHGVWGGLAESERKSLHAAAGRPARQISDDRAEVFVADYRLMLEGGLDNGQIAELLGMQLKSLRRKLERLRDAGLLNANLRPVITHTLPLTAGVR